MQQTLVTLLFVAVMAGCAPKEPPLPPVPPVPPDLSPIDDSATWSAPHVIDIPEPPQPPPVRPAAPNEKLYAYEPQTEYVVPVQLGWPADIVLEAGEKVHAIFGGDLSYLYGDEAPRWEVKQGISESEYTPIAHVLLAVAHAGLKQGIVITTSRRTYHITVKSVNTTPIRTVRWTYPAPPITTDAKPKEPTILPDPSKPKKYHVGYELAYPEPPPDFLPGGIWDDGTKTYILFSGVMLYQDAPLLRLRGPNGFEVVNSRLFKNVLILDRLISRAELRYGTGEQAQIVNITRGQLRTISCPNDDGCPTWPEER